MRGIRRCRSEARRWAAVGALCSAAPFVSPLSAAVAESELAHNAPGNVEALRALGYADTYPTDNPDTKGVTVNRPQAFWGFNLISSRHRASAQLTDMSGRVVHTWQDSRPAPWMHVELQPNGDLLALAKDRYLLRINAQSKVLWRCRTRAHHDFAVDTQGRVLVISRDARSVRFGDVALPVLADKLVWVSKDGKVLREKSLLQLYRPYIDEIDIERLRRARSSGMSFEKLTTPEYPGDLTHTNSVKLLRQGIGGIAPAGSILLSARELDRIFIVDKHLERVLWSWGEGVLDGQHHATQLDNGHLLVFNNRVAKRDSRPLEIDPQAEEIVWSVSPQNFFTRLRGAAQKLPNGDVLLTESDEGHAIELTKRGRVVWEYWNPDVIRNDGKEPERAAIYRLLRYSAGFVRRALGIKVR